MRVLANLLESTQETGNITPLIELFRRNGRKMALLLQLSKNTISINQLATSRANTAKSIFERSRSGAKELRRPTQHFLKQDERCAQRHKFSFHFLKGREQSRVAGRLLSKSFKPFIWRALAHHKSHVCACGEATRLYVLVRKHTALM